MRTDPTVRVWDRVVRVFHWTLVTAFATAFLVEEGERLHDAAGYVVLGLIAEELGEALPAVLAGLAG